MIAYIRSIGASIPERRISNEEFARRVDTTDEWIVSHTGISFRHVVADGQATSDLAIAAANTALKRAGLTSEDLDMIMVATATPDFLGFPATACIVQNGLRAPHTAAMDIVAGCTGFIYGLETARGFISSGFASNVLIIGAECLTRVMDWDDRDTCVLFGDGAGAAIVSAGSEESDRGIIYSFIRSQGSGARFLERTAGGSRFPFDPDKMSITELYLHMDGRKVYNFAVRVIVDCIKKILKKNGLDIEQVKYIVPHQANIRIVEAAAKRSKIPMEKFYMNIAEYANTSAATIPIALNEMWEKKLLKEGDLIITVGFGAGLTYGGNLIRW